MIPTPGLQNVYTPYTSEQNGQQHPSYRCLLLLQQSYKAEVDKHSVNYIQIPEAYQCGANVMPVYV